MPRFRSSLGTDCTPHVSVLAFQLCADLSMHSHTYTINIVMKSKSSIKSNLGGQALKPTRNSVASPPAQKKSPKGSRENPAPTRLAELIARVNQIPIGIKLESLRDLRHLANVMLIEGSEPRGGGLENLIDKLISQEIAKLPQTLKEFVGPCLDVPPFGKWSTESFVARSRWMITERYRWRDRYEYLVEGSLLLSAIAKNPGQSLGPLYPESAAIADERGHLSIQICWKEHSAISCIDGIDSNRVRRCLVCDKFFWAGHGNKKWCDDVCGHRARSRSFRRKHSKSVHES